MSGWANDQVYEYIHMSIYEYMKFYEVCFYLVVILSNQKPDPESEIRNPRSGIR